MPNSAETPFHEGELALQDRIGAREHVNSYAPKFIRSFMPEQHREFYNSLPYFFMGSVDKAGMPWASLLWGTPGFVESPDNTSLVVQRRPQESDPLYDNLTANAEVGMLGLQFHTHRRNRVNGRIAPATDQSITINVTQSFGNCPKYIQARDIDFTTIKAEGKVETTSYTSLSENDKSLINESDTFFIASVASKAGSSSKRGVDISHRGGEPGFVKTLEDGSLLFPDFTGNMHFNTFGNIHETGTAGLLFIDYENGDLLHMTGKAEIIWPEDSEWNYEGAERFARFIPEKIIRRIGAMPFKWHFYQLSPYLPKNDGWQKKVAVEKRCTPHTLSVVDIVQEAASVKSFYLAPTEENSVSEYSPGQHLPIEIEVDGKMHRRSYTLSSAHNRTKFRISVKREDGGTVSKYLHDTMRPGGTITARNPGGAFILQKNTGRPAIFLSAGIGITPMMAMTEELAAETKNTTPVYFIHGARREEDMVFLKQLRDLNEKKPSMHLALRFSNPSKGPLGLDNIATEGRINEAYLNALNLPKDGDFYLCGPAGFMQMAYDWLTTNGFDDSRIHFEAFGPSSVKRRAETDEPKKNYTPVDVTFAKSGVTAAWNANEQSLLELAEENGIEAPFSCRSGNCGSCLTPLLKGKVSHKTSVAFPVDDSELLTCCAVPEDEKSDTPIEIDL